MKTVKTNASMECQD